MTNKNALLATVGLIAVASLIVGLQQTYIKPQQSALLTQTVLGEATNQPELTPEAQLMNSNVNPTLINATPSSKQDAGELAQTPLQLCAEHEGSSIWACSARGLNYYAVTPPQLTTDIPMDIYDTDGTLVLSCGGLQVFTSDTAATHNQKTCAQYSLSDCQNISSICLSQ